MVGTPQSRFCNELDEQNKLKLNIEKSIVVFGDIRCFAFQMILVLGAIFGVVLYRIIMVAVFYAVEPQETIASLATSITASLINLIVILILSVVRKKIDEFF